MTNLLYEGIDKELASKDAEIAALRKALGLVWAWADDPHVGPVMFTYQEGIELRDRKMAARHAKDVALALLTPRTL